jgi:hypothetical protein
MDGNLCAINLMFIAIKKAEAMLALQKSSRQSGAIEKAA